MTENEVSTIENDAENDVAVSRIYEVGYHIAPSVKEEDIEKVVGGVRSRIEKEGGSFIAEGAPSMTRFSYAIEGREAGKRVEYDRGYFGWIKFEGSVAAAKALESALKQSKDVIRFILFRTVREDTRAKYKAPTLREVKRTDTIKSTPRRTEEQAAPVSEEELDKALQDITAE
ncbi:MAG: 30S ribosomal protein S6 [Candidatus Kaiserbacteria bacterium]|nr:MAG: 30S ribosomal protein S6 [Candidatus Kaiserbacteria bacterium]